MSHQGSKLKRLRTEFVRDRGHSHWKLLPYQDGVPPEVDMKSAPREPRQKHDGLTRHKIYVSKRRNDLKDDGEDAVVSKKQNLVTFDANGKRIKLKEEDIEIEENDAEVDDEEEGTEDYSWGD